MQVSTLMNAMGPEAEDILASFGLSDDESKEYDHSSNSSLSAPTKIEELTAGSDEETQRSPAGNRTQDLANSSRTL